MPTEQIDNLIAEMEIREWYARSSPEEELLRTDDDQYDEIRDSELHDELED